MARFPLSCAPDLRSPIDASGAPFMMLGDAAWSLIADLPREDALRYLDDRASRGFNTLLVSLLERKFARHAPANFYMQAPFLVPDGYATPNEAYFEHADWVLARAEERGMLVLLTPSYIGYLAAADEGWYAAMAASGEAKLHNYGRFLGERFRARHNIVWVHAGDDDPPDRALVRAIALGIRELDGEKLHCVHARRDTVALDYWAGEDWIDLNTVYTRSRIYDACAAAFRRSPTLPALFIEGAYENEQSAGPTPTEAALRRQAYHSLLSGAFGHVFGNNPIWHFEGPSLYPAPHGWREALNSRGAQSMTLVRLILERASWSALEPDLEHTFLTQGLGNGEQRAVAAVTRDRRAAIVYAPSPRRLGVDLARLAGPELRVSWIDPSNGETAEPGSFTTAAGIRQFMPPPVNAAGMADWVLLVETA